MPVSVLTTRKTLVTSRVCLFLTVVTVQWRDRQSNRIFTSERSAVQNKYIQDFEFNTFKMAAEVNAVLHPPTATSKLKVNYRTTII